MRSCSGVRFCFGLSFSLLFGEALCLGEGVRLRASAGEFLLKAFGFWASASACSLARRSCSWRRRSASARSAAAMRSCSRRSASALASASACSLARRSCSGEGVRLRTFSAAMRSCARRSASAWPQLQLALWRGALALGEGVRLRRVQQRDAFLLKAFGFCLASLQLARRGACSWRRRSASARSAARCVAQGVRLLGLSFSLLFGEVLVLGEGVRLRAFSSSDAFLLKAFGFCFGLSFSLLFG